MTTAAGTITCLACGEATLERRRRGGRGFHSCDACGAWFLHPQPTDQELAAAYRSFYYPDSAGVADTYGNTPAALGDQLLDCLQRHRLLAARGRLLDFGCGFGELALTATHRGHDVHAVEPDAVARQAAAARGVRVHPDLDALEQQVGGEYDAVTLVDVLEHVRRPLDLLRSLRRVLRSGGTLYISVPNHRSAQAWLLGDRWDQATNPTHLFLFSPASLRFLLSRAGFRMSWLPCALHDPRLSRPKRLLSSVLQRLRLTAALRVAARAI